MAMICPTCDSSYPDDVKFCARDGTALRAEVARDDFIGELIADRYVITGILGKGGMGTVYLARHVRLQSEVAIKILHADLASDPALLARFRGEARAGSLLRTDRVAQIHDFGVTIGGHPFIAMEYVRGRTLADVLDERGTLEPQEVAQIVLMVAEGLDAAHRIDLIHRDLKPENVMIVEQPGLALCTKVLDFGIAKGGVSRDDGEALTQVGFVIGSPRYMSPEQVLGEELDARSDVYALGLLAFVALTGTRPFARESVEAERLARVRDRPKRLDEVAAHIDWPSGLQSLFDRVLAFDVNQRPGSALAFAKELQRIIVEWTSVPSPAQATPSGARPAAGAGTNGLLKSVPVSSRGKWLATVGALGAVAAMAFVLVQSQKPDAGASSLDSPRTADVVDSPARASTNSGEDIASQRAAHSTTTPVRPPGTVQASADAKGKLPRTSGQRVQPAERPAPERTSTPGATREDADLVALEKIMAVYDADTRSESVASTVIESLTKLKPRLTSQYTRGWAEVYLGWAWQTRGDKPRACEALYRAKREGDPSAVKQADEWILRLGCPPSGHTGVSVR
jgi:serine/threonine protein kinase